MVTIETERLLLNRLCEDDVSIVQKVLNEDPSFAEAMALPVTYCNGAGAHRFYTNMVHPSHESGDALYLALRLPHAASGLIGVLSLEKWYDETRGIWSLAYWLEKDARGQGYMAEAAQAAISWLQPQGATEVRALVADENQASANLCQKLGFQKAAQAPMWAKTLTR